VVQECGSRARQTNHKHRWEQRFLQGPSRQLFEFRLWVKGEEKVVDVYESRRRGEGAILE
jgi:hypothetical protein